VRYVGTLLILLGCAVGCQGPISDWPHSKSDDDGPQTSAPVSSPPGGGGATGGFGGSVPVVVADAGVSVPGGQTSAGGTTAGTSTIGGGLAGGLLAGTAGGAAAPGGSADAGVGSGGTASDAGSSADASLDGGMPTTPATDAQVPDASSDAGCAQPSAPDASVCPGYGCRTTLQQLRSAMDQEGACTSPQALAVACDGRISNAALQCTQESAFSINITRAVTSCLKREPQLAMVGSDCLDCYVDEALCTLSRCFAACTVGDGSSCRACKKQYCSAPLEVCTGLPAP
jgi:hypothetical protein